jgi:predicted O-methyltransferase YrrM
LELITRLRRPRKILEIGPGVGYSALWFMRGMRHSGTIECIEVNDTVIQELKMVIKKAGLVGRIRIRRGPALELLPRIHGPYDIVFIDAIKEEYPAYLHHALRFTKRDSVILAHNMFRGGATIRNDLDTDAAKAIADYTTRIFADKRLSSIIVPLGDGLAVSHRIS